MTQSDDVTPVKTSLLVTQREEMAHIFPNHRALVASILDLQSRGEIDGYSIHRADGGYRAGVRKGGVFGGRASSWTFLAQGCIKA